MQISSKWFSVIVTLLSLLALTASPLLAVESNGGQGKAAVVNGSEITKDDFNREVQTVLQRFAGMGQVPDEAQLAELREAVLAKMIETLLLYQKAQKEGFTVSDQAVTEELNNIKSRFPSEEQFTQSMLAMNITEAELKSQIKQGLTIEKFLDQQFMQKVEVSKSEAKAFYEENKEEFRQPELVKASHILVSFPAGAGEEAKKEALQQIKAIQDDLQEGGDFAALAREHSQCPSGAEGGDLGYFGRGQMVPEFEQAAFGLEPGQVSDIVETQFGYHLIKVEDKKAAGLVSFEETEENIREHLKQQKAREEIEAYLLQARKDATIEIPAES
jgi:peptidyl-prolyl cis-trans isomerase C